MNKQYCGQCGNRCPADALRCSRGRARFEMDQKEPETPAGLIGLLQPLFQYAVYTFQ